MQLPISLTRCLLLVAFSLGASACGDKVRTLVLYPPAADVAAATEAKPVAPVDIITSEAAADAHDIAVETWGERVRAAGVRICNWSVANGAKFDCPKDIK